MTAELSRYRPMARALTQTFFLPGADREDVEQEAMIGAWFGLCDYREGMGMSRDTFVEFCARRRLMSKIRSARAGKHVPLNEAQRMVESDGEFAPVIELVPDDKADPQRMIETRESLRAIVKVFHEDLTPSERSALVHVLNGLPYVGLKWIDNGAMLARRKLRAAA